MLLDQKQIKNERTKKKTENRILSIYIWIWVISKYICDVMNQHAEIER